MERKEDLSTGLSARVIGQGFSNQLKKLRILNKYSPRIFMIYADSLYEEDRSQSDIVKQIQGYLNPTIKAPCVSREGHLRLNLYSNLALQGNDTDVYNERRNADVLDRQMCLLPKHQYSVDYVIFCGSRTLREYAKIKEVGEYTTALRKILNPELSKEYPDFNTLYTQAESALNTLKIKWRVASQELHNIYTELAFLTLRKEEKDKDILPNNDLIQMIIDGNMEISSDSGTLIYLDRAACMGKDPKAFYLGMFALLKCLFGKTELSYCRIAIENAQRKLITNTDPALWTLEDKQELDDRHSDHKKRKTERHRKKAKKTLAPSTSSEETSTEELPKSAGSSLSKTTSLSPTTIPDLDGAKLKASLQAIYKQNSTLPRLFSKDTEAIANTFVNVSILKEETVKVKEKELDNIQENKEGKQADDKDMQDNRLHSHERLYQVHEPILIEKLFAPLSATPSLQKLLLYGRAGIGKTVLCQYLANQWAEGCLDGFQQFQAVFWIKLRELVERLKDRRSRSRPVNEEMILAEMVTVCCLIDSDWQKKIKKQQLEVWLKANAKQTLFILDGYDEVAETASTGDLGACLRAILDKKYSINRMLF